MNSTNLPDVFCWTKMGTEAGQSLENIIARKEAERDAETRAEAQKFTKSAATMG